MIAEVRGSVISSTKLNGLLADGKVAKESLPVLIHLNPAEKWLISPKNISKYLFRVPGLIS
jgi:hypothetical protein